MISRIWQKELRSTSQSLLRVTILLTSLIYAAYGLVAFSSFLRNAAYIKALLRLVASFCKEQYSLNIQAAFAWRCQPFHGRHALQSRRWRSVFLRCDRNERLLGTQVRMNTTRTGLDRTHITLSVASWDSLDFNRHAYGNAPFREYVQRNCRLTSSVQPLTKVQREQQVPKIDKLCSLQFGGSIAFNFLTSCSSRRSDFCSDVTSSAVVWSISWHQWGPQNYM